MRPNLFNANISSKIARGLGKHLLLGYLTRIIPGVRNSAALTGGETVGQTSQSWTFRGLSEEYDDHELMGFRSRGERMGGAIIQGALRKIIILGGTLPDDVDPMPGDILTFEGSAWRICSDGVKRDPAGATFTCHCEGTHVPSVSETTVAISGMSVVEALTA